MTTDEDKGFFRTLGSRLFGGATEPQRVSVAAAEQLGARLPPAPKGYGPARWLKRGETLQIGDREIVGGLIYAGRKSQGQDSEPSLIDPSLPISPYGDYRFTEMDYWPNYASISAQARRAYLDWLADGRKDPAAQIGYAFLYFYGLEARVLTETPTHNSLKDELCEIEAEVDRLLDVYGDNRSFRRYAGSFQDLLRLLKTRGEIDLAAPLPELRRTEHIPTYLRLVLGELAKTRQPVPAAVAVQWLRHDPQTAVSGAMRRIPEQYDALFKHLYGKAFDGGLVLPVNRTRLKCSYWPASGRFRGRCIEMTISDVPDVTVLKGPIEKLRQFGNSVNQQLVATTRVSKAAAETGDGLWGWTAIPQSQWPPELTGRVEALKKQAGSGLLVRTYGSLIEALGGKTGRYALAADQIRILAEALQSAGLGIEPDILAGARIKDFAAHVVVFADQVGATCSRVNPEYRAAQLMLQIASAVAASDGSFGPIEMRHLAAQVKTWSHLGPGQASRLMAHLRLLVCAPATLTGLKKKVETLSQEARTAIAEFLVAMAHADGAIDPAEVKMLEKAYRALGIDSKRVFGDLHAMKATDASTPLATSRPATSLASQGDIPGPAFQLDRAKVAALQRDTARVAVLLTSIFTEEPESDAPVAAPADTSEAEEVAGDLQTVRILGLDENHSVFVRTLLERIQWSRDEAGDVATDLGLMLDGALERINEAAFDLHGEPISEGDDPIEINSEIREALEQ